MRCAPAIGSDGTIYAGSDDSRLLALKPTGELLWSYWGEDRANARAPAIGPDGTIYVLFGNGAVHALAPGGALEWKCRVGGPIRTSPAVGPSGTIFVTSYDRWLYAISPAGAVQWKFRIPTGSQSPVIGPGGTVYVASTDSHLYALTPEGGLKWKYETESEATHQPAVGADGTIYVGLSSGSLEALRPTGQRRWRCEVAAGGYLGTPTLGADGTIYVASRRRIYALSQDGSPQWDYGTDANIRGQPVIGTHGALYFALADGSVCALGSAQTAVAEIAAGPLPSDYALDQNVPNPFNSCTAIKFALAGSGDAQLTVYNLGGQRVAALVQEARAPGRYTITWDGRDDRGRTLATGVYLYRLRAGAHTLTRKLLLLR